MPIARQRYCNMAELTTWSLTFSHDPRAATHAENNNKSINQKLLAYFFLKNTAACHRPLFQETEAAMKARARCIYLTRVCVCVSVYDMALSTTTRNQFAFVLHKNVMLRTWHGGVAVANWPDRMSCANMNVEIERMKSVRFMGKLKKRK